MHREHSADAAANSPGSPPGMTTSKSSKSSSFQSLSSEDGSVLADIGHFEDIGLDDDNATLKAAARPTARRPSPSPSPSPSPAVSPHLASSRTLSARPAPRPRRSFPNLHVNGHSSNPRSTSLAVLTDPRPITQPKGYSASHSTTSLPISRRRSPSPGLSLNPRGPSLPPKPRRGSSQGRRRSFAELESTFDEDEGDDIPDGFILDNVPISPRPPSDRPPSRGPSPTPDPTPKERVRSVGNGTPAIAQAQGSLRSPAWKQDGPGTPGVRPQLKARAQSWNIAHAELNAEARALTEKLEEHADEVEEKFTKPSGSGRPNTWNASRRSVDNLYDKKERVRSTPELPPLRRTNIMIDPLPVSKEKEAVLSRTRPSWLPPKDPAEERRHLREYQKMVTASAKADERREAARRVKVESKDSVAENAMHIWENDIVPRWGDSIRERRTRELWWKGVPPRSRGLVWTRAIGNVLGLSGASFQAALGRAQQLEERVRTNRADSEDVRRAAWLTQIRKDAAENTLQDLRIFQVGGPLHDSLVDVLSAYAMYRSDIGYVSGCNTIAALLLLNLPDRETTFVALANVLNRPLPLAFYTNDAGAQASAYNIVLQTLGHKSPLLVEHLTRKVADLQPEWYLSRVFTSIFTNHLAVDEAARLWDVYVFEGDALLVRAAVALLLTREMTLLGTRSSDEVLAVMSAAVGGRGQDGTFVGADRFIATVREAGKS